MYVATWHGRAKVSLCDHPKVPFFRTKWSLALASFTIIYKWFVYYDKDASI